MLKILSLFSTDISEKAVAFDKKTVKVITIIGIPSAFLLHGYVGFIFGSVKANPWWSSVMMPVVFLFSAIVSGIAIVMLLYMIIVPLRGGKIDMKCLDKMASFLFYAVIVDFSIEVLDFIHRLYESEESIKILSELVTTKLFMSLVVLQILLGMLLAPGRHGGHQGIQASGRGAEALVLRLRFAHPARDLQHPVECGDRRPALLEELPGVNHL